MHIQFKQFAVDFLVKFHFAKGVLPYQNSIGEILSEHYTLTGYPAIMHKKVIYYTEMITDTAKIYAYSRDFAPPAESTIVKLTEFDEQLETFTHDRKRFYAFMRKIANNSKSPADMLQLVPENLHEAIYKAQLHLDEPQGHLYLTAADIAKFKEANKASYDFLKEQHLWDNLI